jgi:hypothetical protein
MIMEVERNSWSGKSLGDKIEIGDRLDMVVRERDMSKMMPRVL